MKRNNYTKYVLVFKFNNIGANMFFILVELVSTRVQQSEIKSYKLGNLNFLT